MFRNAGRMLSNTFRALQKYQFIASALGEVAIRWRRFRPNPPKPEAPSRYGAAGSKDAFDAIGKAVEKPATNSVKAFVWRSMPPPANFMRLSQTPMFSKNPMAQGNPRMNSLPSIKSFVRSTQSSRSRTAARKRLGGMEEADRSSWR